MQRETLPAIRARVRALWGSRRVCGIVALACAFRIDRIATLAAKGRLGDEEALRMALETEAVAMLFAPLPRMERCGVSL
ncbi:MULTISPECIES: hypothetical protein [unclassified Methylobacterium]|uniref:hypothetical protein n=1 Tax=unclassified Methylobacterium TaxID=2615210 RepID=UPI0011C1F583|nr:MULTISPECIES: hypothetical protein [unclassified Methylobacterium]QEE39820.1 hypothetical protein FVA80_13525 [Methylobacterium sp. WL1]TXN57336.1 hypothetical protein FV241_11785 [Methylobacterium sp. WL2]